MGDDNMTGQELARAIWERAEGEMLALRPVVPPLPEYESPEHDPDLRYLNSHWTIDPAPEGPSSGNQIKDRAKERLAATTLGVLDRYFSQEREYFAHSVRFAN